MKIFNLYRLAIVIVTSCLFHHAANAQSIALGIRGGGAYNTLLGIDSSKFKQGIVGGLTVNYQTEGKWSISADMLYAQRGATSEKNIKNATSNISEKFGYNYSINYLEIPVLFSYNFLQDSSKFKARAFFGPSLNVRMNSKNDISYTKVVTTSDSSITTQTEGEQDLAYIFTPLDYGFVGGIGLSYAITDKIAASVDIRANYGLLDIREYLSKSSAAVRNANFNVLVGVTYRLSK